MVSRLRHFFYAVLIIFTLLLLCYFLCLTLGSIALFQAFFCKMSLFLGGRALSFALFKWGCSGSLALAIVFSIRTLLSGEAAPFSANMMLPTGANSGANCDQEVTSPSSANWQQYLDLSSEKEGASTHEPSTSSTWVEKGLFPEVSSSAPEKGSNSFLGELALRGEGEDVHPPLPTPPVTTPLTGIPPSGTPEKEGTAVNSSIPRVARDEAGPSHQPSIVNNSSLESSIRGRISILENDNSPFLLDKERGGYWKERKQTLDQAPTQDEYTRVLNCENLDLQIRERKHACLSLFQQELSNHPALGENAAYNPKEAFIDFFDQNRNELDTHLEWSPEQSDRMELQFIDRVEQDIRERGLKINPIRKNVCSFGITAGNFPKFLVHNRGVEIKKRMDNGINQWQGVDRGGGPGE